MNRPLADTLTPAYDALDEQEKLARELKNSPYLDRELRTEEQVKAERKDDE